MKKYTVYFTETVVYKTEIEADTLLNAALAGKKLVEADEFPNDCPERQSGEITAYDHEKDTSMTLEV